MLVARIAPQDSEWLPELRIRRLLVGVLDPSGGGSVIPPALPSARCLLPAKGEKTQYGFGVGSDLVCSLSVFSQGEAEPEPESESEYGSGSGYGPQLSSSPRL